MTGTIPEELGGLTNLVDLGLEHNRLTGGIPEQLADLDDLRILMVNNNSLETPVELSVRPTELSESDGPTVITVLVDLTHPGTRWVSKFDPAGKRSDSVATGTITATVSGDAGGLQAAISPARASFNIGSGQTRARVAFTLEPTDDDQITGDTTVTFTIRGTGAPRSADTNLVGGPVVVTVANDDTAPPASSEPQPEVTPEPTPAEPTSS